MRYSEIEKQILHHHTDLNPVLWDGNQLKPIIRYKLLKVVHHFVQFLGLPDFPLKDVTINGSNAAYSYNEYSDIDLHLLVSIPSRNTTLIELYDSKTNLYNNTYNIRIKGIHVELYIQDVQEPHISLGVYSLLKNKWLRFPTHSVPLVSNKSVIRKIKNYNNKIRAALTSNSIPLAQHVLHELRRLRKAGLHKGGEFSIENLAWKQLRAMGNIAKLRSHITTLQSRELSLKEKI